MGIREQLEKLRTLADGPSQHVAILGGGISGLVAAYELATLGYKATIFEASRRIGGRILTSHYGDQHGELGAMRIPRSHDYTLYYCALLGLKLGKFVDQNPNAYYDIQNRVVRIKDGSKLIDLFNLSPSERVLVEGGLGKLLEQSGELLLNSVTQEDIEHLHSGDFEGSTPWAKQVDAMSFLEFLAQHNQTQGALALMSSVNYLRDLWHSSCTGVIREVVSHRQVGLHEVVSGMEALPQGIYQKLINDYPAQVTMKMGAEVTSISVTDTGVRLTVRDDRDCEALDVEYVLCTLPFPVLRRMSLRGISADKMSAIANYTYASSTKVVLNFKKRFWEAQQEPIFGGASVTDTVTAQCFYPANHARDYLDVPAGADSQPPAIPRAVIHDLALEPSDQPPMENPGPGVMLASYGWGSDARRLQGLRPDDRIELVKDTIKRFHDPSEVDRYFDGGATMAWDLYPWAAGAFARLAPRDLQMYFLSAIKREGKLFFSGEHLSHEPGWIQGSLISTLSVLEQMLTDNKIRSGTKEILAETTPDPIPG